jgi:malonate-semialdehyde dehydrogenase (acetylating)/methylmalonate-semialdehyde dehydrogenase
MMTYIVPHFISGKRVQPKETQFLDIYNPALGKKIGRAPVATPAEINQAVESAKKAFISWSAESPNKRAQVIFKYKQLIEKHRAEIAALITQEHGKLLEDAKGSVSRGLEVVDYYCGIAGLLKGDFSDNVANGVDCYTFRQALGVCVGVTPFNFPAMIPLWMLVPAIACGNTFILKPSEKDPSAPLLLAELFQEAGLPEGVLSVLQGDKSVVDHLITHEQVSAVACVGSTPVAKHIYSTAIAHGKRAHTFGGAKNHCIVMPDADLKEASAAIANAAFGAAGERCMALSVAIAVGDSVGDALVKKARDFSEEMKMGPGDDPNVHMGPLVTREHWERVKKYVDLGVDEGAELVVDGREFKLAKYENGFFMGPSLFDHVKPSMQIYREEIFGPVLCIVRVKDFDEAIELINRHEFGNGTAIFTKSGHFAREFARRVQVGMVGVNVPIPVPVGYHTFGGWKNSIFGDVHMHAESLYFYTRPKTVTTRWG